MSFVKNFTKRSVKQQIGIASGALAVAGAARLVGKYVSYRWNEKTKAFNSYTTSEEALNGLDLRSKTVIVTGANIGIGKETVKILVKNGCKVFMACRSETKANAAKKERYYYRVKFGKFRQSYDVYKIRFIFIGKR